MAANCPLIAFLCLSGALLTDGVVVKIDPVCPEGWSLFGSRCFRFFHSKESWTEAEGRCHDEAANLASIHSAEESDFIVQLIQKATGGNRMTWLGGHDAVLEGIWMWTDGSPWDYTNWETDKPDDVAKEENCLMINYDAHTPTLCNDYPDHNKLDYICAKDAPPVSLTFDSFLYKCTSQQ